MRVRFWGVRGSLPVPGPKTERYGGNTSCVEVRSASGHARRRRRRHRDPQAGQGDRRRRRRTGRLRRAPADQPHPLGPHPGAAVLLAALPAGEQAVRLRAQARRPAPAGGVRLADRSIRTSRFPSTRPRPSIAFRELSDSAAVRDRRREGRLRAPESPLHRDRLPPDVRRRVGRVRVGHRAVLRHPVRGRVHRAAAVGRRRAARARSREAAPRCARAWSACARAPTWSSTTRCSPPTTTGACRTTATRAPRTRSNLPRGRRAPAGAVPPRARALRRRGRHASWPTRGAGRRAADPLDVAAAYEGLDVELGRELMRASTFWGVRGSIPAPGPGTVRYGGNTSCVSVRTVGRRPHRARLRHGRAQPGHVAAGRRRSGRGAARRASCCRTPTGTTSRGFRSSCRSTSRATASRSSAAPRARRCWRGSSRGRWRRSTFPSRR